METKFYYIIIFNISQKVSVHCHAGRGRTGMVIAAWLMYNLSCSADKAIKYF